MKIDEKYYQTISAIPSPIPQAISNARLAKNEGIFSVQIIDQTLLPHRFELRVIQNLEEMVTAIKTMQVRGAPLIGAAAAYGMALAVQRDPSDDYLHHAAAVLLS